jgi:hypothetical protein
MRTWRRPSPERPAPSSSITGSAAAGSRLRAKSVFDQVPEGVWRKRGRSRSGPPDPKRTWGRSVEEQPSVTGYIEAGVKEGARVVTGGKKVGISEGYSSSRRSHEHQADHEGGAGGDPGPVCAESLTTTIWRSRPGAERRCTGSPPVSDQGHQQGTQAGAADPLRTVWINCHNVSMRRFLWRLQSGWGRNGRRSAQQLHRAKAVTAKL